MSGVDLAIYVGALDYFWEWQWLPEPPAPPAAALEGSKVTFFDVIGQDDRQSRQSRISNWRDRMTTELGERLSTPLEWDETDRQYAVATPGSKCWTALMLWAAYAEFSEEPPAVVRSPNTAENDPIFQRLGQLPTPPRFRQIVQNIDYWLPAPFDTVHESTGPEDGIAFIGSSPVLLAQLEALNEETWKADRATIQEWSEAGEPASGTLESWARYAFAELLMAAQYSCDNHMPMKYYFDISTLSPDSGT